MDMIILSIHLIVSVCVVGLVLLQRSEGGALGIGGGGGGALMSGRGASDAMARLTWIAGALFLGISLLLTWLSSASDGPRSTVIDTLSTAPITAPSTPGPAEDAAPAPTTPDPTESRAPSATEMAAALPGPSGAAAAEPASTSRAAPIEARQTANLQPAAAQRNPQGTQTATPASAPRSAPQNAAPQPLPAEVSAPESVDPSAGVETVRRERAGPDQ